MKKIIAFFLALNLLSVAAFAQENSEDDIIKNTQNDILIVAGAGAAGAILGLSTLSFVDMPSRHISNIWTGAALGIIAGVVWVAYNSAQRGQEDLQGEEASLNFNSSERLAWHQKNSVLTSPQVQFGTEIWRTSF
ncbi:MAG: hypothetical protein ACJ76H_05930 [Bacteriovoracaceae bacterium]